MKKEEKEIQYPGPPDHLSERARELWRQVIHGARSPGRQALLQTALEALDRADEAREVISREGLTTTTKTTGAVHIHPLLKVERENRALFARLWKENGFGWDHEIDSVLF